MQTRHVLLRAAPLLAVFAVLLFLPSREVGGQIRRVGTAQPAAAKQLPQKVQTPTTPGARPLDRLRGTVLPGAMREGRVGQPPAGPHWGTPVLLETVGGTTKEYDVAANADGSTMVAWTQSRGDSGGLFARRYNLGTKSWDGEMAVLAEGRNERDPDVEIGAGGDAVIAWRRATSLNSGGDAFGAACHPMTVSWHTKELGETTGRPRAAVDSDGDAVFVWPASKRYPDYTVRSRAYGRMFGWRSGADLVSWRRFIEHVDVAASVSNWGVVVWETDVSSEPQAPANAQSTMVSLENGQAPPAIFTLENGAEDVTDLSIALDDRGKGFAIWRQGDHVWVRWYAFNAWQGAATRLDTEDVPARDPHLATNGAGNAVAIWTTGGRDDGRAYAVFGTTDAVGFSRPVRFDTDLGMDRELRAGVTCDRKFMFVWKTETAPLVEEIRARIYDPVAGGWGTESTLGPINGFSAPELAVDCAGRATVVWEQDNGMNCGGSQSHVACTDLWAVRYE